MIYPWNGKTCTLRVQKREQTCYSDRMANNRMYLKCPVCGKTSGFASSCFTYWKPYADIHERLTKFFADHEACDGAVNWLGVDGGTEFRLIFESAKSCQLLETI